MSGGIKTPFTAKSKVETQASLDALPPHGQAL
jgi:hypothetical protein